MDFFKSSFFSDLKLQDVLMFSQEDLPSTSGDSETLITPGSATSSSSDNDQGQEAAGIWGLGSLMKSITSKSEGILQAYRKDLEEFGSGLKKESQLIAEVAAHAVKDLPTSLETGAYMAQESIESVGQVVEDFSSSVWRGTTDLIAQGKEAVLRMDEDEGSTPAGVTSSSSMSRYDSAPVPISAGKYSRFEAQVRAMQHDSSTYCDEPGDLADYTAWKSTFSLADKKQDIDTLVVENTFLQELLLRFVPDVVSEDIFWTRYFYRLHKLQQTEEARADLVKRASALEEEDLSWDTEEEPEEGVHDEKLTTTKADDSFRVPDSHEVMEEVEAVHPQNFVGKSAAMEILPPLQVSDSPISNSSKVLAEEEEDLGWEVPEDVEESSSNDGKRSSNSEASWEVPDVPREEIRKRLAAQDDEEEVLGWDIDDGVDVTK
ncbi:hypothetical protein GOP47_0014248 [Adiantum capillus-veneris]|uniref:BSD domain-containing protein n=1 Tax=Adiantum capillus-veneris TaxID=13818 RepID=A0A9D4UL94_ADICA|nr:hypothetical protein GOP47_0014248 [Adiantum capillus-veneris]